MAQYTVDTPIQYDGTSQRMAQVWHGCGTGVACTHCHVREFRMTCITWTAFQLPQVEEGHGQSSEQLVEERFFDKINIKVKGYDHPALDSYVKFVTRAAKNLDIDISGRVALPTRIQKYTVIKSPHIFKKHRAQFEMRTHARLLQVGQLVHVHVVSWKVGARTALAVSPSFGALGEETNRYYS